MSKSSWFYYFEGQRAVGPLEKADMIERIQAKKLGPYQLVIRDGDDEWQPALAFPEFRELLQGQKTSREPVHSWVVLKRQDAGGRLAVESLGPFTSDEIRAHLQAGRIEYTDYVWKDGMHQWRRLSSLKEFSPFEKPAAPEPLIKVPPAPLIAKQVTKAEVLKKVEVVNRKKEISKPPEIPVPPEAEGPDLAKTMVMQAKPVPPIPETPASDEPPPLEASVKTKARSATLTNVPGSPNGEERRRLPRNTQSNVELKDHVQNGIPVEAPQTSAPPLPGESFASSPRPKRKKSRRDKQPAPEFPAEVTNAVHAVKELGERRISLPRNWKQILVIVGLLFALYVKLFGTPDTIPLSQVPQIPSSDAPMPAPQPVAQPLPDSSMNAPESEGSGNAEISPPVNEGETQREQPVPPAAPTKTAAKKKSHPATKLHARMVMQGDNPSLQLDTDASSDQVVTIEFISGPGQVVDHSHFFKRIKWNPGSPLNMGGELPAGYYKMHASVGNLTADDRFEVGVRSKGFAERLKASRKQSSYEFWSERKRLYLATKQLSKLIGAHHNGEIDRLAKIQPTSFAFSDLWAELKEICVLVKKSDSSAKDRLQSLQNKIAQLTIWK